MSSLKLPCPIWESPPSAQDIDEWGQLCDSKRAGGRFVLKQSGAPLLQRLTARQRANLSYWIYKYNLDNGVFDDRGGKPLVVDQAWVEGHRNRTPSPSNQMLTFLRELIRRDEADELPSELLMYRDLQLAAGGCRGDSELIGLYHHAVKKGWISLGTEQNGIRALSLNHSARIHVEEQLHEHGKNQQAAVPDPAKKESEFLTREVTISNIRNLPIDAQVVPIVEERLEEALIALHAGAHLSVIFLCGSVLEGVLLGAARQDPENFNKANATPKTRTENGSPKPKPFHEWSLAELIDVACEIGVLKPDEKAFGHGLRDFRNYIHPHKQMKSHFKPDEHTAGLCFQALKAALASLAGER